MGGEGEVERERERERERGGKNERDGGQDFGNSFSSHKGGQ